MVGSSAGSANARTTRSSMQPSGNQLVTGRAVRQAEVTTFGGLKATLRETGWRDVSDYAGQYTGKRSASRRENTSRNAHSS